MIIINYHNLFIGQEQTLQNQRPHVALQALQEVQAIDPERQLVHTGTAADRRRSTAHVLLGVCDASTISVSSRRRRQGDGCTMVRVLSGRLQPVLVVGPVGSYIRFLT